MARVLHAPSEVAETFVTQGESLVANLLGTAAADTTQINKTSRHHLLTRSLFKWLLPLSEALYVKVPAVAEHSNPLLETGSRI